MGPSEGLQCQKCGHINATGALRCAMCQSAISSEDLTQSNILQPRAAPASPAQSRTLAAGTLLAGRYDIVQLLGQGGMGTVYKARDVELDRLVAIKVIRADLANEPRTLARFKQELILARQITHKNVIRIFDLGTH